MKKMIIILLLSLISVSTFANCDLEIIEKDICVNIIWEEGPHMDAYSTNKVKLTSISSNTALSFNNVEFYPWMIMDGMEHGSSAIYTSYEGNGSYLNEEIYFFSGMDGIWQFRMKLDGIEYVLYEM